MTHDEPPNLLDHVVIRVSDLKASKCFYTASLEALGRVLSGEEDHVFWVDNLYFSDDGAPTRGLHIAFEAADRDAVHRFHDAALAAGGSDNGPPGLRDYEPGYYAAFVLDLDDNNVEAVFHDLRAAQ